jgi:hypothetical protein
MFGFLVALDGLYVQPFRLENTGGFQTNSEIHNINTRHKHDLCVPNADITNYQKGVYCARTKPYKTVPSNAKILNYYIKQFKSTLDYYLDHCLYAVEQLFST